MEHQHIPYRALRFPHVKGNAFWRQKMRTCFRTLDVTGDGRLGWADFHDIAEKLISTWKNCSEDKKMRTRDTMKKIWEGYFKPTRGDSSKEDEFLVNMLERVNCEFRRELENFGRTFFGVIDANDDGTISKSEYEVFTKIWRFSGMSGAIIFDIIDTDGNGKIDMEEYLDAAHDFFFNEDPKSPFKVFWGPLQN